MTDVFIINIFPKFEIIQLPCLHIKATQLCAGLHKNNINFCFNLKISKENLLQFCMMQTCNSLILLKLPHNHLIINITMTELLQTLNDLVRLDKLKAFW